MLKKILVGLVAVIGALLVVATMQPDTFRVQREATIQAPPDKVFAFVNDFRQWPAWSPWEKLDPAMTRTLGGPPGGLGATYGWKGNKEVGQGRMEIIESAPPGKLTIKLDFLEPFEAHDTADFSFEARDGGTRVTWAMHGPSPFVSKVMGLFVSMDKMIGKDFETGLANLKAAAER